MLYCDPSKSQFGYAYSILKFSEGQTFRALTKLESQLALAEIAGALIADVGSFRFSTADKFTDKLSVVDGSNPSTLYRLFLQ